MTTVIGILQIYPSGFKGKDFILYNGKKSQYRTIYDSNLPEYLAL